MSLADVARRAGTSAATLSRYENGWTRFETYTLRKLATALGCDLHVELAPRAVPEPSRIGQDEAVRRLARLFWDHPFTAKDLNDHPVWVFERVLEYGNLEDIDLLRTLVGKRRFIETAARADRVSPRTRTFWRRILEREGVECTRKYSRNTSWNS